MLDFPTNTTLQSIDFKSVDYKNGSKLINSIRSDIATTKEIFDALSEYLYVGVWRANSNGVIVSENSIMYQMLHKSLVNNTILSVVPNEDYYQIMPEWNNFLLDNNNKHFITTFRYDINNTEKWFQADVKKLSNKELLGVLNDVTLEKSTIPKLIEVKNEMKNILKKDISP